MFGRSFFGGMFFGGEYFGAGGSAPVVVEVVYYNIGMFGIGPLFG